MMFAPLEGWRHVKVTDRHAAVDYAHVLKDLSDTHFPGAAKIVLVQDNLSTHTPASLYAAFPAAEARRLATSRQRLISPITGPGFSSRSGFFRLTKAAPSIVVPILFHSRAPSQARTSSPNL